MAYTFDFANKIIDVESPQTDVDIQDLFNAIRTVEDSYIGMGYATICSASGKESLGGTVAVGITLELLNGWQLRFWAGNYIAKVSGGNLVGGLAGDPIAYTSGVQVLLIQSSASTIVTSGGSALTTDEHNKLLEIRAKVNDADLIPVLL